jgi:two-component sensor histidine kinase
VNTASAAVESRPADLFVTRAKLHRREVAPDLQAEAAAFCELSKILADDPGVALRHLLDIARNSCHAGSAGLSLLRDDGSGRPVVHWAAISGALASHEGADTPRDSSPCGLCLDAGATIRVSRPQRAFSSLRDTQPEIVEDLIVPLYDKASKPLGTLWIAHHDRTSHFSSDDARVAEQLAAQLVLALNLLERTTEHRRGLVFKDAMLQEVNHRTKNTLQMAASLLVLQANATPSAEARIALLDSYARLLLLAKVHELLCTKTDGAQTVLMPGLLQTLADGLRHSFGKTATHVGVQLMSDPISLPVDQAIALALLANELVTNAYKHAFPGDCAGVITLSLQHTPKDELILRIADTGIGLNLTGSESGLGLKLIRTLVAQLQGTLTFATPPEGTGTQITLTIRPAAQA